MPILINIHFPDGSKGVGPFVSKETPKDLAAWHRFVFTQDGEELAIYHEKPLSRENIEIALKWAASQRKKKES